MLRIFAVVVLALSLSGCSSGPRLDTSSEQAVDASLKEMKTSLISTKDKRSLALALSSLAIKGKSTRVEAYKDLNGLTAKDHRAPRDEMIRRLTRPLLKCGTAPCSAGVDGG